MPSVSDKQHNAMEAAAHGHSTLGIPKSVGQDFVAADKHMSHAHKANYNSDHHADDHGLSNAHPHQSHSERHHSIERPEINPHAKSFHVETGVVSGTNHGGYRHHVHPDRDMEPGHHPPTHSGEWPAENAAKSFHDSEHTVKGVT